MIGWAAATGGIGIESIVLFLIIFFWTPPHFWALALLRADEYSRAGIPMLPVTAGRAETRRQIVIYSLLLAPLGVVPALMGFAGLAYGGIAGAAGIMFVLQALRLLRAADGPGGDAAAKALFGYSILYLFALFAAMLIENRIYAIFGIAGA
jgi:protoheme IX farnesyltransferase